MWLDKIQALGRGIHADGESEIMSTHTKNNRYLAYTFQFYFEGRTVRKKKKVNGSSIHHCRKITRGRATSAYSTPLTHQHLWTCYSSLFIVRHVPSNVEWQFICGLKCKAFSIDHRNKCAHSVGTWEAGQAVSGDTHPMIRWQEIKFQGTVHSEITYP
jgi:hypothetical protein